MEPLNFYPFPELKTQRLTLRALKVEDDEAILKLRSHPSNSKYLDRQPAKNIDDARSFISKIKKGVYDNEWLYWGICRKGEDQLIGTICLWNFVERPFQAETGYELYPDFQGKGFMQEALEKIIDYAFNDLKLQFIEACTHQKNEASIHLLKKNNFKFSRPLKSNMALFVLQPKNSFKSL